MTARRTLASLRNCWGYRALEGPAQLPSRLRVCPMDTETHWHHVSGRGPGAVYEQDEAEGEG